MSSGATLGWMPKALLSKEGLERNQIPIYATALLAGAAIGLVSPAVGSVLEGHRLIPGGLYCETVEW